MSDADPGLPTNPPTMTLHLTLEEVWARQASAESYVPEAYAADGFIHCTNGESALLTVANTFYRDDRRPHVVLTVALDRVTAPVRYDDHGAVYPHVYGPLNRSAVVDVRPVARDDDGAFLTIG